MIFYRRGNYLIEGKTSPINRRALPPFSSHLADSKNKKFNFELNIICHPLIENKFFSQVEGPEVYLSVVNGATRMLSMVPTRRVVVFILYI